MTRGQTVTAAGISLTADHCGRIARAFILLGLTGFWVQFVLLIAVVLLGIWTFSMTGARAGAANVLAFLAHALPLFTTFWCWRYARGWAARWTDRMCSPRRRHERRGSASGRGLPAWQSRSCRSSARPSPSPW